MHRAFALRLTKHATQAVSSRTWNCTLAFKWIHCHGCQDSLFQQVSSQSQQSQVTLRLHTFAVQRELDYDSTGVSQHELESRDRLH